MDRRKSRSQILIINDDREQQKALESILNSRGYATQVAESGERALERIGGGDIALALIDLDPGEMSGLEVLTRLKQTAPDKECILLVPPGSQDVTAEALKLGAFSYLHKPVVKERLLLAVRRALEKVDANQELAELRAFHENIVQNMMEGVTVEDEGGYFTFVNERACELLGYAERELLGSHWSTIVPQDQQALVRKANQRRAQGISGRYEIQIRRKDGDRRHVLVSGTPLHTDGEFAGSLAVFTDISEHVRAEKRMRLQSKALESAANAMLITDRRGKIEWVNPAFSDLTGYSQDEAAGETPRILKSGKMEEEFYARMWKTITSGNSWQGNIINRRKDGTLYIEEQTITPVANAMGEIAHYIAVKKDVTNETRAKHTLMRQLKELRVLNKIAISGKELVAEDELITEAVHILADTLYHDHVEVLLLDDERKVLVTHPSYRGLIIRQDLLTVPVGEGVVGRVAQEGKSRYVPDVKEEDQYIEVNPEVRSELCVPIARAGEVLGVINVEDKKADAFGSADQRLLTTFASQLATALERVRLFEEAQERAKRLEALHRIDRTISSALDIDLMLNVLLQEVRNQLNVDAADVLLYNADYQQLEYAAAKGFKSGSIKGVTLRLGQGYGGRAVSRRQLVHFPDLSKLDPAKTQPLSFVGIEGFQSYAAVPLIAKGKVKGVLEVFHRSPLAPDAGWFDFLRTLATQAAIAIDQMDLFEELQHTNVELIESYEKTLEGWAKALEMRDHETGGHSDRVLKLTMKLADALGVEREQRDQIRMGALLHDIGKMGVPDHILHKPGPLNEEERRLMKKHPVYAKELLSDIPYLKSAMKIPYCHHERWDGSGYPRGLKGDEIPLAARIFAVADVWDALLSDRPYREAWDRARALEYIEGQKGKQFDPVVVDAFLRIVRDTRDR